MLSDHSEGKAGRGNNQNQIHLPGHLNVSNLVSASAVIEEDKVLCGDEREEGQKEGNRLEGHMGIFLWVGSSDVF